MKTTILGISFEIVDYDANYEVVGTSDNYSFTNNLGRGRDLLGIGQLDSENSNPAEYHANIDLLGNYGSFDVRVYAVSDLGIRSEFIQSNIDIAAPSFDGTFMFSNIQLIKNGKARDGEVIKTPTKIDNEFITSSKFTGRSIHLSWSLVPPPGHPREGESVSTDLLKDDFFNRFEISIKNGKDKIILNDQQLNASTAMQELLSSANVSGSLKNYRDFTLEIFGSAFNDLDLERNVSIEIKCFDSNGSESIGIIHLENPKPVLSNFLKSHKQLGTYFSWDCNDEDYENLVVRYIAIPGGQELTDDSDLIESAEYLGQMKRAQNYININNKIYRLEEKVLFGGVIYECIQEHTTSDLTTPEVGGNSYWNELGPKYPCLYRTVGEQLNSFDIVQVFGYNYFYAFQPFDEYGPGDVYNLTNEGLQIQSDDAKLKGFGHDLYIGSVQAKERKDDLIFSWNILDHQFNKVDLNKYKSSVEEYGMPLVLGISGSLFDVDTNQELMKLNESRNQGVDVTLTEQNPVEIGGVPDYEIYDRYEYTREINNSIYGTGGFPESNEFDYEKIYSPDTNNNYTTLGDLLLFKSKIQNSITNTSGPSIQNSPPYIRPYYDYWNSNLTYLFGAGGNYDCHILIYDNKLYKLKRDFGPESQDVKEFFNEENNYQQGEIVVAPIQSVKVFNSSSAYLPSDLALFRGRLYVCKAEQTAGNAVSPELGVAFWEERSLNSSIGFGLFKAKSSITSPISVAPFKNDSWEFLTPNVATDYFELYIDSYYLKGSNEYNTNYVPNIDEWNNSVKYFEGLFVSHKNNIWLAKKNSGPSTSRGFVEPGEDSDYWVDSLDVGGSSIDFFTDHNQGDLVFYHNAVFKCLANNPTGAPLAPLTSLRQGSSSNYEDSQWKPFWEVDDSYDSVVFGHVGIPESGKRDVGLEVGIVGLDGGIISSQKITGINPPPAILRQGFTASSTTKASRVRFNFNYKEGFAEKTTKVNLYRSIESGFDITGSNKFAASSTEEFLDAPTNSIPNPDYNASFVKTIIGEGEHADFGDNITEIFDDPPLFVDSDGIEHPTGYYYKILPFDDFGSGNLYGVKDNMHDLEEVIVYPKSYHSPNPHDPIGEIPKATQPGVPAGDTTTIIVGESIPGPVANFTGVTAFENYFLNWDLPNSEISNDTNKLVTVQPNDIDHFEVWESNESHLEVNNTELTKDQNLRGYRRILGDLPSFGNVPPEELDIGYDITNATEIMEIAGDGFSFEAIHQGRTNERRYFWIRAVDAAGNKSPFTGAADLATDTVEGLELTLGQAKTTDIADFEQNITATFPNTLALIPNNPFENNFSLASNSTKNGTVSWEEHFVYYNGEGYLIKEGETDDAYVYWSATGQIPTHNFTVRDITSSELAALGLGVEGGGALDASKSNPLRNLKYVAEYDTSDYHPAGAGHSTELNSSDPDAPYNNNEFPNLLGETDDFIIARNANGIATTMWHSFANATIGTAHIEEAAITSAKIHTLTADKIRSAEIKGQDIQVGGTGQIRSFNFPGLVNPIEDQPSGFAISGDGTFIFAGDEGRLHFDDGELVLEGKLRTKKGKEYTFIDLDASPDSFFYNELSDGTYTPDGDQTCNIRATFQNSFIESNEVRFKIESPDGTEFVSYDDVDLSDGSYNENGFTYNPSNPLNKFDSIEEPRVANAQLTVGGFNSMINTVDPQLTTIIVSVSGVNTSTERSIPINFVADGAAAVYVELTANQQVFEYDSDGENRDPATDPTLTATDFNTHGKIYYNFKNSAGLSLQDSESNSYVVPNIPEKFEDMPITFSVDISGEGDSAILASDRFTFFGTHPGKDSYTVFLTNENHTYPANEVGDVSSVDLAGGKTQVRFFKGNQEYAFDETSPFGENTFSLVSVTSSDSAVTHSEDPQGVGVDRKLFIEIDQYPNAKNEGTFTIKVKDNQYSSPDVTFEKIYTYSKAIEGVAARKVDLLASKQAVKYNTAGESPNPTSITLTAEAHNTVGTVAYIWEVDNSYSLGGTGSTRTFSPPNDIFDPIKIKVKISENGTSGTILAEDEVTIYAIQDGSDVITAILSNEAHTLPKNFDNIVDYSGSGTTIQVYQGTTPLGVASSVSAGFYTITAVGNNIQANQSTTTLNEFDNASNLTADVASITFTIVGKDLDGKDFSIVKTQSFSISAQGIRGNRGVGITFRGVYDPTEEEYIGAVDGGNRGDVVEYNGSYYLCIQDNGTKAGLSVKNPTDDAYWEGFGAEFSSVATDILLAKDVGITHSLVMGTVSDLNDQNLDNPRVGASTNNGSGGIIRSANKTEFGDGNEGFFLGDTSVVEFEVGDSDSFIKFDTDSDRVEIKGSLIINSRDYTDLDINSIDSKGDDAIFIGGGYNNFITGSQAGETGFASSIVGGGANDISGRFSFIGGGFNNNLGDNFSAIVAGYNNEMPNLESGNAGANFIGAGVKNIIDGGTNQTIVNGFENEIFFGPEDITIGSSNFKEIIYDPDNSLLAEGSFGKGKGVTRLLDNGWAFDTNFPTSGTISDWQNVFFASYEDAGELKSLQGLNSGFWIYPINLGWVFVPDQKDKIFASQGSRWPGWIYLSTKLHGTSNDIGWTYWPSDHTFTGITTSGGASSVSSGEAVLFYSMSHSSTSEFIYVCVDPSSGEYYYLSLTDHTSGNFNWQLLYTLS